MYNIFLSSHFLNKLSRTSYMDSVEKKSLYQFEILGWLGK